MDLKEYYQYYLTLHQNKKNRALHFLGQCATITYVTTVVYHQAWLLLLVAPFIVYPFAWSGHRIFEKNKPLALEGVKDGGKTTLKAKACDWLMFFNILRGKLSIW